MGHMFQVLLGVAQVGYMSKTFFRSGPIAVYVQVSGILGEIAHADHIFNNAYFANTS